MSTTPQTSPKTPAYENNPFFVAINGFELLFKKAKVIGIILAVLAGLSTLSSLPSAFLPSESVPAPSQQIADQAAEREAQQFADGIASVPMEAWLIIALVILIVALIFAAIGIVVRGVLDYTSAQIAHDKEVALSEALRAVFVNFWGYTWVLLVAAVKTFLWTLLFIIPGIIMAVRYSLAGVVYFDKKLSGNGSVKESARLTKNGWLTTFASQTLLNILTLGVIQSLLVPGTQAILYRQFTSFDTAGVQKPSAHTLSWLTLLIPILFFGLIVLGLVLITALSVARGN